MSYSKPVRTIPIFLAFILCLVGVSLGCKPSQLYNSSLQEDGSDASPETEVEVAFQQPLHQDVATFLNAIQGKASGSGQPTRIKLSVLRLLPRIMGDSTI
jgi:hypothetical protein